jgi:methyl-accepting chemotaxis protein
VLSQRFYTKLLALVGIGILTGFLALSLANLMQMRTAIVSQNERTVAKLTDSAIRGLQTIMLAGYADIAQGYAANLKQVPAVLDFRIIRTDGKEAFHDNATIEQVNARLGDEEFIPRESEAAVQVLTADDANLQRSLADGATISYYATEPERGETLTFLTPIANTKRCFRCHGKDAPIRGLVKFTTSMQPVQEQIRQGLVLSASVSVVIAIVILAGAFVVIRRVSMPILDISHNMTEIAEGDGDLTVRLEPRGRDEIAQLATSFNTYTGKVRDIVRRVTESTRTMKDSVGGILDASGNVSSNMQHHQGETHALAASAREMATTMQSVVGHVKEAAATAAQVDEEARTSKQLLESTIESIGEAGNEAERAAQIIAGLYDQIQEIATVVDTINDIAGNVNILAVNAAIESASAGEHGKGFAVVANEVRRLSTLTRAATRKIEDGIAGLQKNASTAIEFMRSSLEHTQDRVARASKAGVSVDNITSAITEISLLNTQIDAAMRQQAEAAKSIDTSIQRVAGLTEDTMESMDRLSSRNVELSDLAASLTELVERFKT